MTELLRHYRHEDRAEVRQTLLDIHASCPEHDPADPFVERFPWFVDHWSSNPGFTCVVAYRGDIPLGFIYGAPQEPGREWWREYLTGDDAPADTRTYAVSELAVRPQARKTGLAERLHEALMNGREEALAVLLVDTAHPKVQARYEEWGYRQVGDRRPFPDSPLYAVMVNQLRKPSAKYADLES